MTFVEDADGGGEGGKWINHMQHLYSERVLLKMVQVNFVT